MTASTGTIVRGAGGIVLRRRIGSDADRAFEVIILHRPHYDDWSLPKGKLHRDETYEDAAHREVEEETGLRCELAGSGGSTSYIDHKGRDKIVRYFLMLPHDDTVALAPWDPTEIDEARWVPLDTADGMLSHQHDRILLRRFLSDGRHRALLDATPTDPARVPESRR